MPLIACRESLSDFSNFANLAGMLELEVWLLLLSVASTGGDT
jgi:hypothetical protein